MNRSIRELQLKDINFIIDYFLNADHTFLNRMGVDPSKLPKHDTWEQLLLEDLKRSIEKKKFFYMIWELNGLPIGHSNINKIIFAKEAYMHLHLWNSINRKSGHGMYFIQNSIFYYFEKFHLDKIYCAPSALNPAPNKVLQKIGFEYIKKYDTIPGWINYHQSVNRWVLTKEKWFNR